MSSRYYYDDDIYTIRNDYSSSDDDTFDAVTITYSGTSFTVNNCSYFTYEKTCSISKVREFYNWLKFEQSSLESDYGCAIDGIVDKLEEMFGDDLYIRE